jgi:heme O synthase-like polyprenyltransferase
VNCQTLLPLLALAPLSLLPGWAGASRAYYWVGALFLSLGFLYYGTQFVLHKSSSAARQLLAASIIYLPLLFLLIVFPRG